MSKEDTMTYPFCPECGLDWKDCKCTNRKLDAFTREHLQAWADSTLHEEERDSVVQAIIALVEQDTTILGCDGGWPAIRDMV